MFRLILVLKFYVQVDPCTSCTPWLDYVLYNCSVFPVPPDIPDYIRLQESENQERDQINLSGKMIVLRKLVPAYILSCS